MCQQTNHLLDDTNKPPSNRDLWIFDGGTGREIERRGGPFRQPEWSALTLYENPSLVRDVHESFLNAGATAITTNTYAIVPFHLGQERYDRDSKWLLELATDLAVQAKDGRPNVQVLGSIPPISGSYKPGAFEEAIAKPIIHDFLNAFSGKVDAIILETMGSAQEAKFALKQIYQSGINVPVYLSFHIQADENSNGQPRLLTGDSLTKATDFLQQSQLLSAERVPLVMVNCCDLYLVEQALQELSTALGADFRLGAYPNAFSAPPTAAANVKARQVNNDITPALLQFMASKWIDKCGASVVGGCCGIGPDHIRAVAQLKGSVPALSLRADATESPSIATEAEVQPRQKVHACGVQGCGCGVQVGFGQQLPLCAPTTESNQSGLLSWK